ncbi:MAG: EamA family transporter RarD [bacterium]
MFDQKTIHGAYFALSAYVFWGIVPVYFKFLTHVSPLEILIQRILWSVVLLLGILAYLGQLQALRVSRRNLGILFFSSLLLSVNWMIFIYAILDDNIIETSLGYFINPLVSVFLGVIFLGERLRPLQWLAIAITAGGITYQLLTFGAVPWLALGLAFSFGFYGLIRKNLNLPSVAGLALETMLLAPIALVGLFWIFQQGELQFSQVDIRTDLLLILTGVVTSFPLLCFASAVTRLSLTAIGMFQYIAPSIALIIAVIIYNEPFGTGRVITFTCIWVALIILTVETFYHHGRHKAMN